MLLAVTGVYFLSNKNETTIPAPVVAVGIRIHEIRTDSVTLTWRVTNKSEQDVTFGENQIVQIKLNGREVPYPAEATTLAANETASIDIELVNIDIGKTNELKITAASNEGTVATFQQNIGPGTI